MLPITNLHGTTKRQSATTDHNRPFSPKLLYPCTKIHTGQPFQIGPELNTTTVHGDTRHIRSIHSYPNTTKPPQVSRILLSSSTILLPGPAIRTQRGTIHFHKNNGLAPPNSQNARSEYHGVSRRHRPLAVVSRDSQKTGPAHNKQTDQNGVLDQHCQITNRATRTTNLARHTMAPSHGPLADGPRNQRKNCVHNQTPPRSRTHNETTAGGTRWTNQLCMPSPLPFKNPFAASHKRILSCVDTRQRCTQTHTTTIATGTGGVDRSDIVDTHTPIPSEFSTIIPLDRRIPGRMGSITPPTRNHQRDVEPHRQGSPHQHTRTTSSTPRHSILPAVKVPPRSIYRQRDGQVYPQTTEDKVNNSQRRTKITPKLHGGQENNHAPTAHSDRTECSCRRVESSRTSQHRVDTTQEHLPGNPEMGRSAPSRYHGFSSQPSITTVGITISTPRCNGLQLSRYRLERIRQHLRFSTNQHDTQTNSPHPQLSGTVGADCPMGPNRTLATTPPTTSKRTPTPAHSTLPDLRCRPCLPQVRDLRQMDRISFLRRALLASRPPQIVTTLLAKYRQSSQKQQQVAWKAFQRWLPSNNTTITKNDVLCFLQSLFSEKSLAPRTIMSYRAAIQWPLEEAFGIEFSHPDFSRLATGFFHLRPPLAPSAPQWNLTAVLRFYERIENDTCAPRILLLKTLCLTALASGNRCSELAHLSRSAVVDNNTRLTLPVIPRFLYKNQTQQRCPPPIIIPHLPGSTVCPVSTMRTFLRRSSDWEHHDFVFVNPSSHASLVAGRLNYWLVKAIATANEGGEVIRAHDMRKFAFSINWARQADLSHIIQHGFWGSAHPFLNHYLHRITPDTPPCVAAGSRV